MIYLGNKKTRAVIVQVSLVALVFVGFAYFIYNANVNLERLGIASGFDFLWTRAGYDLYSPVLQYSSDSLHIDAYFVGLLNTILVSVVGIFLATVLGFLLGILRLSNNWLASKTVYCIVEFTRNVPVLVWIVIWYFGIFLQLPSPKKALNLADTIFVSNRGMYVPSPEFHSLAWGILIALGIGVIGKILYTRRAKRMQDATGKQSPIFTVSLTFIIGLPLAVYFVLGQPVDWSVPALRGFNFKGGVALKPEFIALLMGLSVYTASNIAEIVRSGIESVDKGQYEASMSLNLTAGQRMKMIIIPQALRVIIPPLNSQYLNLMKNSSLAIAIGYVDVVATIGGITLNQTGQALECIAIVMATYLILSLLISAIMNFVNRQVQIVER